MAAKRKSTEQFIIDAYCKHGDKYNYKLVEYKNVKTKVKIICPIHGVFEQRPDSHLSGFGCQKCGVEKASKEKTFTAEQFIIGAWCVHGDKYNYKLVDYKNAYTKVKIICPIHGIFEQTSNNHLCGRGCRKCVSEKQRKTLKQFIIESNNIHNNKYDYSLVEYKNAKTKVKIICHEHGVFRQRPHDHLKGHGCPKCVGFYEKIYAKNGVPVYDTFAYQLQPYGIECKRNEKDNNILEVKCMYCGRWYVPTYITVQNKIECIKKSNKGESNLYCSDKCKHACPTYYQKLYPKDFKLNTSREVQPALRKLVLKRDNYTCQKCGSKDKQLHCHHYEGIEVNPVESADIDMCIILCKDCHNEVHRQDGCKYNDMKCKEKNK